MSNKKNTKTKNINKKQLISITSIITIITGIIIAIFIINKQNDIDTTNNSLNVIDNDKINIETNEKETNNNVENTLEDNDIIISDSSLPIYFEEINTNDVDDFSFFTPTKNENTISGTYKVITKYSDYIEFAKTNNIDITKEQLSIIDENYFENHTIICVIDSFEETYQYREFVNFSIKESKTYINYVKTNTNETITSSGFWTYMIGIDYSILGKTEIEKLPISIQVLDKVF